MPIPNDDKLLDVLKIKEAMLDQIEGLTCSETMEVLVSVTAVVLLTIEDAQPTEARRKAVVPQYLEALKTVMAVIRMTDAEFGNQMSGEAVPPKSKLN